MHHPGSCLSISPPGMDERLGGVKRIVVVQVSEGSEMAIKMQKKGGEPFCEYNLE